MLAHEKLIERKRQYLRNPPPHSQKIIEKTESIEANADGVRPLKVDDIEFPREGKETEQDKSELSISNSVVINQIDEAIIQDNVQMFKSIGMTLQQYIDFLYLLSAPKTTLSSMSRES